MKRTLLVALLVACFPLSAAASPITWNYAGTVTGSTTSIPLGQSTMLTLTLDGLTITEAAFSIGDLAYTGTGGLGYIGGQWYAPFSLPAGPGVDLRSPLLMTLWFYGDGGSATPIDPLPSRGAWLFFQAGIGDYSYSVASQDLAPVSPVPEPATLLLLGTGFVGMVSVARRRMRK